MPDTEALLAEYRKNLARLTKEECARLLAAVEAIRALHRPDGWSEPSDNTSGIVCSECDWQDFPCKTLRALDAALSGSEPDEGGER